MTLLFFDKGKADERKDKRVGNPNLFEQLNSTALGISLVVQ